jgi:DNA-directed RNA polymerase specialized sigma24 family protein
MDRLDEAGLLRRFVAEGSDDAFGRIVSLHLNLVYAAALRQVRDPHLAQDVAQSVFVLLARAGANFGWDDGRHS